ncbi:MAG: peptide chain release factor N(5)-glutamine methyltransferase [Acidobacteriaceae bacterium]
MGDRIIPRPPEALVATLQQAITQATQRLNPSPTARRDAELLLLHITGLTRADLLTHPERPLPEEQRVAYDGAIVRRQQQEPVQYITGVQEFYGRPFRVTPAVLIPRPETEHIVEAAMEAAVTLGARDPMRLLDVGTGSGILAVTLALQYPHATVTATDISSAALAIAQQNAQTHGVSGRIRFLQSDLLKALEGQHFDLIVSNLPYVGNDEPLEPQVVHFEPHTALFAGPDGLTLYRRLIPGAAAALVPGGHLLLEIGQGQQSAIEQLLNEAHLTGVHVLPDLQGIPRVAVAASEDPVVASDRLRAIRN